MRPLLLEVLLFIVVVVLYFDEVKISSLPELLLGFVFGIFSVAVVSRGMVIVVLRGHDVVFPSFPRSW